jgi:hypothetical protein
MEDVRWTARQTQQEQQQQQQQPKRLLLKVDIQEI